MHYFSHFLMGWRVLKLLFPEIRQLLNCIKFCDSLPFFLRQFLSDILGLKRSINLSRLYTMIDLWIWWVFFDESLKFSNYKISNSNILNLGVHIIGTWKYVYLEKLLWSAECFIYMRVMVFILVIFQSFAGHLIDMQGQRWSWSMVCWS